MRRCKVALVSIFLLIPPVLAGVSEKHFHIGGGTVDVILWETPTTVPEASVLLWVKTCATALARYYGRLPLDEFQLNIFCEGSGEIRHGVAYPDGRIRITVGNDTTEETLKDDWMLTHEISHLAFPSLNDDYLWMSEGLADYIEPVARARMNLISEEKFWKDLVEGCPQGLPEPGDQGLDETHTWGRIYWGGVIYWLLADVDIRQRTNGRRSIRDALRGILDEGGDITEGWTLEKVLEVGDRATGTTVLKELHLQMGHTPYEPDLNSLWKSLGVYYGNGQVVFDDKAPLAEIRRSITRVEPRPKAARP